MKGRKEGRKDFSYLFVSRLFIRSVITGDLIGSIERKRGISYYWEANDLRLSISNPALLNKEKDQLRSSSVISLIFSPMVDRREFPRRGDGESSYLSSREIRCLEKRNFLSFFLGKHCKTRAKSTSCPLHSRLCYPLEIPILTIVRNKMFNYSNPR